MDMSRATALKLLKRQEWDTRRSAAQRQRRSALSALRRRRAPHPGERTA